MRGPREGEVRVCSDMSLRTSRLGDCEGSAGAWLLHICTVCCSAGCYIFALSVAPVHAHALVCLVLPLVSAVVVAVGAALLRHMHKMSHKTTQSQPRVAYKVFVCFILTGQRLAELCSEQQLLVTEAAASFNAEKQC